MAAPDITLGKGEVLLVSSTSGLGVLSLDNKIGFGTVELTSDLTDRVTIGDSVSYRTDSAKRLMYGSTVYILTTEENVSGVEVLPP